MTDSDCGTWFQTPRRPAQSTITPGTWLVGNQIAPGIYRANVQSGCYWERLRSFGGQLGEILANNFISSGGPQIVEVKAGDTGFHNDGDCGTWTRDAGLIASVTADASIQSFTEIERNRSLARQQWPSPRR